MQRSKTTNIPYVGIGTGCHKELANYPVLSGLVERSIAIALLHIYQRAIRQQEFDDLYVTLP